MAAEATAGGAVGTGAGLAGGGDAEAVAGSSTGRGDATHAPTPIPSANSAPAAARSVTARRHDKRDPVCRLRPERGPARLAMLAASVPVIGLLR